MGLDHGLGRGHNAWISIPDQLAGRGLGPARIVSPAWTTSGDRIRQAGPGQFAGFSFFFKSEFKIKKT